MHKAIHSWCAILLAVTTALPAWGLYRGDEFELRDFSIGALYFINVLTYEPWSETADRFAASTNAFIGAGGSISSDDLYLYQRLGVRHAFTPSLSIETSYLQDRDFDGTFEYLFMGLDYNPSENWSISLVGIPTPDKARSAIGSALGYRDDRRMLRLQILFPHFVYNGKNPDDGSFDNPPVNVQVDGRHRFGRAWSFFAEGDLDFPLRLVNPRQSFVFDYYKYQGRTGIRRSTGGKSYVEMAVETEYAHKERQGLEPADKRSFRVDRTYWKGSVLYLRPMEHDTHLRAGAHYIYFDEHTLFPFNAEESLLLDRQDRILFAGRSWPLRESMHLNSLMMMNLLYNRSLYQEEEFADRNEFFFRAAGSLLFRGDRHEIELGAAVNLTQVRFGGGFLKVFMDF